MECFRQSSLEKFEQIGRLFELLNATMIKNKRGDDNLTSSSHQNYYKLQKQQQGTMKYVIKADGTRVPFDPERVVRTCMNVGVDQEHAETIAAEVEAAIDEETESKQVYDVVLDLLEGYHPKPHANYKLREAVAAIEPHLFEQYVAKVLEMHGYSCITNQLIPGAAVTHEVDVIAKKNNTTWMVECKHHSDYHTMTGLDKTLIVQARLEDLQDGFKKKTHPYNFSQGWLINNTKYSFHAKQYAAAKNILLSGWHFQEENSFAELIQAKNIHPITVLNASPQTISMLFQKGILTLHDVAASRKQLQPILNPKEFSKIYEQVGHILNGL
ncbi:restriction endonuclease [Candidatus Woesearchaeota archaeon]|nr:restriction endonuclease [Candidatus Woesearchaeota archaeon]